MTVAKPNIVDRLLDGRSTDPARKRPSWAKPRLIVCHIQEGTNDLHDYWNNSNIDADSTMWCRQTGELDRLLPDDTTPWTNGDTDNPTLSNPTIADIYNNKIPLYGALPNGTGIFNHYSLTIEHQGFDTPNITPAQAESTAQLAAYWCSIYKLDPMVSIVGHRDIGKKSCPGALFPLDTIRLRAKNLLMAAPVLPYGATIDTAGNIHVNGFIVGFGFRDYWISCGGADKAATITNETVIRAARVFGLPVENEHTDADGKARQHFERYIMVYDPHVTGDWQFSGGFIN